MAILVIRVYRGEHFPVSGSILISSYWGSEEAESPLVPAARGSPKFCCDLAFNIYRNDERLSNNSPVILSCYLVNEKKTKQKIGSLNVDVSSLTRICKRYALQNVNGPSDAPLLFLSSFKENNEPADNIDEEAQQTKTSFMNPVIVDGKYIQIGEPVNDEFRFYTFALTLMSVENLFRVFPLEKLLPPPGTEFNFFFYMFGQAVTFRSFTDPNDRDSVRQQATAEIFTSPKNLLDFLVNRMPNMTLLFCCNSYAVAEAIIPIGNRVIDDRLEKHLLEKIQLEPLILSGSYTLTHLFKSKLSPASGESERPDQQKAVVDVVMSIGTKLDSQISRTLPTFQGPKSNTSPQLSSQLPLSPSLESEKREMLYSVVLELEVWKEQQKKIMEQQIQEEQKKQLELLNQEYIKEISKRDSLLKEKLKKCEEMEKQLEKAISTTQQREQHFNRLQANVQKETTKLKEEHSKAMEKIQQEHRRQRDLDTRSHNLIVNELKRKIQNLEAQLKAAASKHS